MSIKVKVTATFIVEVDNLAEDIDDWNSASEDYENEACAAADIAAYEALAFVQGNAGYNLDIAETTTVHVDGHGECEVTWPGDMYDVNAEVVK